MNPQEFEQAIHQALRSLPDRKAPVSLELRVLAEIQRRAALPWWRRSWTYWPAPIRWLFLVVSATLSAGSIALCVAFLRGNASELSHRVFGRPIEIYHAFTAAARAVSVAGNDLLGLVPHSWLYAGIGGLALFYLLVVAASATAYRTLWQSR